MSDNIPFQKTFTIYQKHIDFLGTIDKNNDSNALRKVLDNEINHTKRKDRTIMQDRMVSFISYGCILWLISYLITDNPILNIVTIAIGAFLFGYGAIGGIKNILRYTRRR